MVDRGRFRATVAVAQDDFLVKIFESSTGPGAFGGVRNVGDDVALLRFRASMDESALELSEAKGASGGDDQDAAASEGLGDSVGAGAVVEEKVTARLLREGVSPHEDAVAAAPAIGDERCVTFAVGNDGDVRDEEILGRRDESAVCFALCAFACGGKAMIKRGGDGGAPVRVGCWLGGVSGRSTADVEADRDLGGIFFHESELNCSAARAVLAGGGGRVLGISCIASGLVGAALSFAACLALEMGAQKVGIGTCEFDAFVLA